MLSLNFQHFSSSLISVWNAFLFLIFCCGGVHPEYPTRYFQPRVSKHQVNICTEYPIWSFCLVVVACCLCCFVLVSEYVYVCVCLLVWFELLSYSLYCLPLLLFVACLSVLFYDNMICVSMCDLLWDFCLMCLVMLCVVVDLVVCW